jgi:hypothetical protein
MELTTLRGGLNNTDPPSALAPDQCTEAINVEWLHSTLGEKRAGTTAVDIAGSTLLTAGIDAVTFLYRHLPTAAESDAELWALGVDLSGADNQLARKTTAWAGVTPVDALVTTGDYAFQVAAQTLHGKLFLAYKSAVDFLHVWDGTTLRRVGFPAPAAPTGADTGSGSFATTRYYRVRWTQQVSGSTVRRSEPSATLTFAPSGSGTGVVVTRPTAPNEGETHWELIASINNSDWYRVATTAIATTTATDSVAAATGYAVAGTIDEEVTAYTRIYSARFLSADEDRLLVGGSFENPDYASRVSWTPVYGDPGAGNDERLPTSVSGYVDLDGFEGGELTAMSGPVNGSIYCFKRSHIYKLTRTGQVSRSYAVTPVTKAIGALPGSLVEAVDQNGNPCLYFWDARVGPCRIGSTGGLEICSYDILTTVRTVNLEGSRVVHGLYDSHNRQVRYWLATGASDYPNLQLVLHTNLTRPTDEGVRKGWTTFTGRSSTALSSCVFADNVDDGVARSLSLTPIIGLPGWTTANGAQTAFLQRCGVGSTDALTTGDTSEDTYYRATVVSRPFTPYSLLQKTGVQAATLLAKAAAGVTVYVRAVRDFGIETLTKAAVLTPVGSEAHVVKPLDSFSFSDIKSLQVGFGDYGQAVSGLWELNELAVKTTKQEAL